MRPKRLGAVIEAAAHQLWNAGRAFIDRLRTCDPSILLSRAVIDPTAGRILSDRYGARGHAILDRIWTNVAERWPALPRQATLGATITVRLAAVTATAYDAIVAETNSTETATETVYDIAWALYKKMGRAAWTTSGLFGTNAARRLRLATMAFRTFPFSAPSYVWQDVPNSEGVVAFNCLHCPVADYFKARDLSELCVRTWCALDFPLAEKIWDAQLVRSGSIAGGAERCDFRWHPDEHIAMPEPILRN